jgi:hypothetical protein
VVTPLAAFQFECQHYGLWKASKGIVHTASRRPTPANTAFAGGRFYRVGDELPQIILCFY